ncbi:hypothetical protein EVAR_90104_1 [Eumeta japonica]|uniref:Uncharacterized protein n=1 Tax=Eumeta variegata TaxID=151549 RepID=A0A4C1WZW5_EUMVA|nr:hypothetical protein EVAR_90104_1 [Eumeta japonica]
MHNDCPDNGSRSQTLKRCCSSGFYARWNSSTKNGTDLRLGVRALLIIARLTVDEKTVQRCWFPRMWNSSTKNGTDLRLGVRALLIIARLTVNEKTCSGAGFRACGTLRRRTAQT